MMTNELAIIPLCAWLALMDDTILRLSKTRAEHHAGVWLLPSLSAA
jgi:hypothetical protein